jgi:hypothetical protein
MSSTFRTWIRPRLPTSSLSRTISNRGVIYQLPLIGSETVTDFLERVSSRSELPQASGRPKELRFQSHLLNTAPLHALVSSTSVQPGETVLFKAYLKCGRRKHAQPLSFFSELRGGRIAKVCIECDTSGKSGEVRGGQGQPACGTTQTTRDHAKVGREDRSTTALEQWCASCKAFKPKPDFSGKKTCQACQERTARKNKVRGEKRAAKKLGSKSEAPIMKSVSDSAVNASEYKRPSSIPSATAEAVIGEPENAKLRTLEVPVQVRQKTHLFPFLFSLTTSLPADLIVACRASQVHFVSISCPNRLKA